MDLVLKDRIEQLFFEASELPTAEKQRNFLSSACEGDSELEQDVLALLEADGQPDEFLDRPLAIEATEELRKFELGNETRIGRYKILQQIGEGGFGVVYMAEQTEPVRRKVALKVIKPGMDSRTVVARFEAERQALAMMNHPNIARVLDGGTTTSGYPYFVMDLVNGMTITAFCDEENLNTKERLSLFVSVCRAIQHAHQKGIIHRDIKPSNVLITLHDGLPVVKVIDFGVAKALNQQLTDKTLFTCFGAMVGTPQYMSPEQASLSGLDVDTRSDVYSLGVLLYEILTGKTPFRSEQLKDRGIDEIRRMIRETEPPKPSMMVSTFDRATVTEVARHRKIEPIALKRVLSGDLDWIVMRAIDKERSRRYATALDFAEDVENYLQDNPVSACPPSLVYKIRKTARRHAGLVSSVATILLMLAASAIFSTKQWFDTDSAKNAMQLTQDQLLDEMTDSIVGAEANQLVSVIDNIRPLKTQAEARIRRIVSQEPLNFAQLVNTTIALGELNPAEPVGDYLLENIAELNHGLCPSLVSVLRQTNYDPFQLTVYAHKAEQARDLPTKVRIAVLGLYLGNPEIAQDMLQFGLDPIQRSEFIRQFPRWHAELAPLAKLAEDATDSAFRSGLIQAVGQIESEDQRAADLRSWEPLLRSWYSSAPDLVTRNSAEWILRLWGLELPDVQPEPVLRPDGDWFVNRSGITMRRIDAGSFTMGDWEGNIQLDYTFVHAESPRQIAITRPFYMADREVTVELFRQFANETGSLGEEASLPELPAQDWNWSGLRQFCNWLSRREGRDECYYIDQEVARRGAGPTDGWKLRSQANGYRLPTEAEWEFACRAGTITHHSWGQDTTFDNLFVSAPSQPCGSTLPNPWGLFDIHGSLLEACEDFHGPYPLNLGILGVMNDPLQARVADDFVVRGRSFTNLLQRSSVRAHAAIKDPMLVQIGLRVVCAANNLSSTELAPHDDGQRIQQLTHALRLNNPKDRAPHLAERAICFLRQDDRRLAAQDLSALLDVCQQHEDWGALRTQIMVQAASDPELADELSNILPNNPHWQLCRARSAAFQEDWSTAAAIANGIFKERDQRRSRWRGTAADQEWHEMSLYLIKANNLDAFYRWRSWMIQELEQDTKPEQFGWTVLKAATMCPIESSHEQRIILDIPISAQDSWGGAVRFPPYGFALYRAGKPEQMLQNWQDTGINQDKDRRTKIFVAMGKWKAGETEIACELLKQQLQSRSSHPGSLERGWPQYMGWLHGLSAEIFLEEAKQLIAPCPEGEAD